MLFSQKSLLAWGFIAGSLLISNALFAQKTDFLQIPNTDKAIVISWELSAAPQKWSKNITNIDPIKQKASQIIVQLRQNMMNVSTIDRVSQQFWDSIQEVNTDKTSLIMQGSGQNSSDHIIKKYHNLPEVKYAQKNHHYILQSVPNDPLYPLQWWLRNTWQAINGMSGTIKADISYESAMQYLSNTTPQKTIIVAVLDDGMIYRHPDFQGKLWDGTNCISYTGGTLWWCQHGYDFFDDDKDPFDNHSNLSHGTAIASILGANTHNGTGMVGIAQNIKIMPIRVCNHDWCLTSDIIKWIQFATKNGASIINASFWKAYDIESIADYDQAYRDAISDFPWIFVTVAGNESVNNDVVLNFPAAFWQTLTMTGVIGSGSNIIYTGSVTMPALNNIIVVASSNHRDAISSFSNYGSRSVDIAAPWEHMITAKKWEDRVQSGSILQWSGWYNLENSTSLWQEGGKDGQVLWTVTDFSRPYKSNTIAHLVKDYHFDTHTNHSILFKIWCDTPSSDKFTDYVEAGYFSGNTFVRNGSKIDSDTLRLFGGKAVNMGWHTGYLHIGKIEFDGIGHIRAGFRWVTDNIDQTTNGESHYGCIVFPNTTEISKDYGNRGSYGFVSGTSFAAPMVAGALATAMSYHPQMPINTLKTILLNTGDDIDDNRTRTNKRLNMYRMLVAMTKVYINELTHTTISPSEVGINVELNKWSDIRIEYDSDRAKLLAWSGKRIEFSNNDPAHPLSAYYRINHLSENTRYFYRLVADTPYITPTESDIQTFITPQNVPHNATGTYQGTSSIYLAGHNQTNISYNATSSGKIALGNENNTVLFTFPLASNTFSSNASTWNGVLNNPRTHTGSNIISLENGSSIVADTIVQVDTGGQWSNTGSITIRRSDADGTKISLYRHNASNDTYTSLWDCTVQSWQCRFSSWYFGTLAIAKPMSPSSWQSSWWPGGISWGSVTQNTSNMSHKTSTNTDIQSKKQHAPQKSIFDAMTHQELFETIQWSSVRTVHQLLKQVTAFVENNTSLENGYNKKLIRTIRVLHRAANDNPYGSTKRKHILQTIQHLYKDYHNSIIQFLY